MITSSKTENFVTTKCSHHLSLELILINGQTKVSTDGFNRKLNASAAAQRGKDHYASHLSLTRDCMEKAKEFIANDFIAFEKLAHDANSGERIDDFNPVAFAMADPDDDDTPRHHQGMRGPH